MEYNVKSLSKDEFLRLWDLVLIARQGIRVPQLWWFPPTLNRVSDKLEDFSEWDRRAITRDSFVGMYFHNGQIWFKPDESYRDLQDTALHEIAHHECPHEAHGKTWRKVYGSALALHLRECGHSWNEIRHIMYTGVVAPNRVFRSIADPAQQRLILRKEASRIVNHAKSKIPVLEQRSRTCAPGVEPR